MCIEELVKLFLATRSQGRAPATVRFYQSRLQKFRRAFGSRELSSLSLGEILAHLQVAGETGSDSTRHHNAVAIEQLHKFALELRELPAPLFVRLEKPPIGQRDRLPTPEETRRLLQHASPEFKLIYESLRLCGARPGELCGALIEHYDRTRKEIVRKEHKTARKTGKARRIPVGQKLKELLAKSIGDRTAGPLYLSPNGRQWTVNNLSSSYRRLRNAAGLPDDLVLYLSRHECGSRVCKMPGGGLEAARRMLGHSNPQTTTRYIHYSTDELADIQDGPDEPPDASANTSNPACPTSGNLPEDGSGADNSGSSDGEKSDGI